MLSDNSFLTIQTRYQQRNNSYKLYYKFTNCTKQQNHRDSAIIVFFNYSEKHGNIKERAQKQES